MFDDIAADLLGADHPTIAQFAAQRPKSVIGVPGHRREETEGVFMIRDGRVEFVPIKMGIAGDSYFEVISGLQPGDQVVTGPYASVRGMAEGDAVKIAPDPARR